MSAPAAVPAASENAPLRRPLTPGQKALRALYTNPRTIIALSLIALMLCFALTANFLAPYSYGEQLRGNELNAPSPKFFFGTDHFARDIFSRVMYGAQVSLVVSLAATSLSLLIGVSVGLLAGYMGGKIEATLMRMTDTVSAFPSILLAVAITSLFDKPSIVILFVALGVVGWTGIARVVRSQVLVIRTLDYISAARALGAGHFRIMFRHVLPNCVSPIIVIATLSIGGNILGEAGLSFLGLGVQDPFPSWGGMLSEARAYFQKSWWMAVFPGMAIVLTVLSFNLLGDGLRDALDPKKVR
jgi:peptide/nickel transport system permease protein